MLWISLHLPQLPLEALVRGAPTPEPVAIVEAQRILVCDARAWHRGVRPGMKLAAATAIVPQLRPLARDPAAETEALLGLASWASQFTPSVALEFPSTPIPTFPLGGGRRTSRPHRAPLTSHGGGRTTSHGRRLERRVGHRPQKPTASESRRASHAARYAPGSRMAICAEPKSM